MADQDNPGQFPREDQEEISRKGGQASSSKQDMSELGKKGAQAQPTEAKREGGRNRHRGDSNS